METINEREKMNQDKFSESLQKVCQYQKVWSKVADHLKKSIQNWRWTALILGISGADELKNNITPEIKNDFVMRCESAISVQIQSWMAEFLSSKKII
jgi:hypothetical protein